MDTQIQQRMPIATTQVQERLQLRENPVHHLFVLKRLDDARTIPGQAVDDRPDIDAGGEAIDRHSVQLQSPESPELT
jgi:hypothetical protein